MQIKLPQVNLDFKKLTEDPQIFMLEGLFAAISVLNVLILYYIMAVVIPFPVTITWLQMGVGLVYARVLGEWGRDRPDYAYFVPVKIDKLLVRCS